jgi:hypothetical protein
VVAFTDGTRRSKQEQPPFVLEICDLPSGTHTATICTHDGPHSCTVDLSAGHGVGIAPTGSLPPVSLPAARRR